MGIGGAAKGLHPLFFGQKRLLEAAERAYSFPTHEYR
jgi:hypothetical protein